MRGAVPLMTLVTVACLSGCAATEPVSPYYSYNHGSEAFRARDYDRAIAEFTEAIRLEARFGYAYHARGMAWRAKGSDDRAIEDFSHAIRLRPHFDRAFLDRGYAWLSKGFNDRAIEDFSEVIRLGPESESMRARAFTGRCIAYAIGNEPEKALTDCNEALRVQPGMHAALNSRGLVHLKRREFLAAIDDYSAAITQDARDASSRYGRGVARTRSGDAAGGAADVAAARAAMPAVDDEYRRYGITP